MSRQIMRPYQGCRSRRSVRVKTLHVESGSPLENGRKGSLSEKLRDQLLGGEMFMSPCETWALGDMQPAYLTAASCLQTWHDCRE